MSSTLSVSAALPSQSLDLSLVKEKQEGSIQIENLPPLTFFDLCFQNGKIDETGEWIGERPPFPPLTPAEKTKIAEFFAKTLRFPSLKWIGKTEQEQQEITTSLKSIESYCQERDLPLPFTYSRGLLSLNIEFSYEELYLELSRKFPEKVEKRVFQGGAVPKFLGAAWYVRAFQSEEDSHFSHIDTRMPLDYDFSIKVRSQEDVEILANAFVEYFILKIVPIDDIPSSLKGALQKMLRGRFLIDGGMLFNQGCSHLWSFSDDKHNSYNITIVHEKPRARLFHLHDLSLNISSWEEELIPHSDYKDGWQAAFDLVAHLLNSDDLSHRSIFEWGRYLSFLTRGNICLKQEVEAAFSLESSASNVRLTLNLIFKMVNGHHFKDPLALIVYTFNLLALTSTPFTENEQKQIWEGIYKRISSIKSEHPLILMAKALSEGRLTFDQALAVVTIAAYSHIQLYGNGPIVEIPPHALHSYPLITFKDKKQSSVIQVRMELAKALQQIEKLKESSEAKYLFGLFFCDIFNLKIEPSNVSLDSFSILSLYEYGILLAAENGGEGRKKQLLAALPTILAIETNLKNRAIVLERVSGTLGIRCAFSRTLAASSNEMTHALFLDLCEAEDLDFSLLFDFWKNKYGVESDDENTRKLFARAYQSSVDDALMVALECKKNSINASLMHVEMLEALHRKISTELPQRGYIRFKQFLEAILLSRSNFIIEEKLILKSILYPLLAPVNADFTQLLKLSIDANVFDPKEVQLIIVDACTKMLDQEEEISATIDLWQQVKHWATHNSRFISSGYIGLVIEIAERTERKKLFACCDSFIELIKIEICPSTLLSRYRALLKNQLERKIDSRTLSESDLDKAEFLIESELIGYKIQRIYSLASHSGTPLTSKDLIKFLDAHANVAELSPSVKKQYKEYISAVVGSLLEEKPERKKTRWDFQQVNPILQHPTYAAFFSDNERLIIITHCLKRASEIGIDPNSPCIEQWLSFVIEHLPENGVMKCQIVRNLLTIYGEAKKVISPSMRERIQRYSNELIEAVVGEDDVALVVDYLLMLHTKKIEGDFDLTYITAFFKCDFTKIDTIKIQSLLKTSFFDKFLEQALKSESFSKFIFELVEKQISVNPEWSLYFIQKFVALSQTVSSLRLSNELFEQVLKACHSFIALDHRSEAMKIHEKLWPAIQQKKEFLLSFVSKARHPYHSEIVNYMKRVEKAGEDHTNRYLEIGTHLCCRALEKNDVHQCITILKKIKANAEEFRQNNRWQMLLLYVYQSLICPDSSHAQLFEYIKLFPDLSPSQMEQMYQKFKSASTLDSDKLVEYLTEANPNFFREESTENVRGILKIALNCSQKKQLQLLDLLAQELPTEIKEGCSPSLFENSKVYSDVAALINKAGDSINKVENGTNRFTSSYYLIKALDTYFVDTEQFSQADFSVREHLYQMYRSSGNVSLLILGNRRLITALKKADDAESYDNLIELLTHYHRDLLAYNDNLTEEFYFQSLSVCNQLFRKIKISVLQLFKIAELGLDEYSTNIDGSRELTNAFDLILERRNEYDLSSPLFRVYVTKFAEYFSTQIAPSYACNKMLEIQQKIAPSTVSKELWADFLVNTLKFCSRKKNNKEGIETLLEIVFNQFNQLDNDTFLVNKCMQEAMKALVTYSLCDSVTSHGILIMINKWIVIYSLYKTKQYADPIGVIIIPHGPITAKIEEKSVQLTDHIGDESLREVQQQYFCYMTVFLREMLKVQSQLLTEPDAELRSAQVEKYFSVVYVIMHRLFVNYAFQEKRKLEIANIFYSLCYSQIYLEENLPPTALEERGELFITALDKSILPEEKSYGCTLLVLEKSINFGPLKQGILLKQYEVLLEHLGRSDKREGVLRMLDYIYNRDSLYFSKEPQLANKVLMKFFDLLPLSTRFSVYSSFEDSPREDYIKYPIIRSAGFFITKKWGPEMLAESKDVKDAKKRREYFAEVSLKYLQTFSHIYAADLPSLTTPTPYEYHPMRSALQLLQFLLEENIFEENTAGFFGGLSLLADCFAQSINNENSKEIFDTTFSLLFYQFSEKETLIQILVIWNFLTKLIELNSTYGWQAAKALFIKMFESEANIARFVKINDSYLNFIKSIMPIAMEGLADPQKIEIVCDFMVPMLMIQLPNPHSLSEQFKKTRFEIRKSFFIGLDGSGLNPVSKEAYREKFLKTIEREKKLNNQSKKA